MPALDKVLDHMTAQGASSVTLKTGEAIALVTERGSRPLMQKTLSDADVIAYIRELAGPAERGALDARTPVLFTYRGFRVRVRFVASGAEAELLPGAEAADEAPAADAESAPADAPPATPAAAAAPPPPPRRPRPTSSPTWRSARPSTRAPPASRPSTSSSRR